MELAEQRYQHWCAQKTLDPELRQAMGRRALERYQREFTGEVFARNTEKIYLDILKGANHGT